MSKLSAGATLALGAAAAYFLDPDNGRARRARAKDQASAALRSLKEETSTQATYRRNVVEGWVHEAKSAVRPARSFDDTTLVQKIKSEVLGNWTAQGNPDVGVQVVDGEVTLDGTLEDDSRTELVRRVRKVEGVKDVSFADASPNGDRT